MSINVKETMNELAKLEKMQAQLELRATQLKEDQTKLLEKLSILGVKPEELDKKILELEAVIENKLTIIRSLDKPVEAYNGQTEIEI